MSSHEYPPKEEAPNDTAESESPEAVENLPERAALKKKEREQHKRDASTAKSILVDLHGKDAAPSDEHKKDDHHKEGGHGHHDEKPIGRMKMFAIGAGATGATVVGATIVGIGVFFKNWWSFLVSGHESKSSGGGSKPKSDSHGGGHGGGHGH